MLFKSYKNKNNNNKLNLSKYILDIINEPTKTVIIIINQEKMMIQIKYLSRIK